MNHNALFVGLTTVDIQYRVGLFPEPNVKTKTCPPDILVGGPATNAAVAFSRLNGCPHLATVIGTHGFSPVIDGDLQETGVRFTDLAEGQELNPVLATVVSSENGDRTIFTHNPEDHCEPSVSAETLFDAVKPEILLLDGYYPTFSAACARLANQRDIPVVMDCGSWKPQHETLLPLADIVICSADFSPPGCRSEACVFADLIRRGVEQIAISRGEKSILFHDGVQGEIDVQLTEATCTLGAGDFLHGAFCYHFLQTNCFRTALEEASKLASFTCRYPGTRRWLEQLD